MACLTLLAARVWAQDSLARAKELYLSAAYDEALVLLEQLKAEPQAASGNEVAQYRVFCLLALERSDEARKAIEDIVSADPSYRPSETLTSPRIRTVFENTRKALLPLLVQRRYAEAKASFERKDPKALTEFEQLLGLLDDPDVKTLPQFADLRTIAGGFLELSQARAAVLPVRPPPAPQVEAPAAPQRMEDRPVTIVDVPPRRTTDGSVGFVPPIVIAQPLPRWAPPSSVGRSGFKGSVEVTIDENGAVTSATLQQSVHPLYDDKLLAMARTWKYKPATRNGIPTAAVKVVEIQLQPSR